MKKKDNSYKKKESKRNIQSKINEELLIKNLAYEIDEIDSSNINFNYENYDDKDIIDKIQLYGTDGKSILPILTDSKGRLKVTVDSIALPIIYKEIVLKNLFTQNNFSYTQGFDTSENINTAFIIINNSPANKATIQLQASPNESLYQIDIPEVEVEPKTFKILTPTRFTRFKRIAYKSTEVNKPVKIDVYYQAQGKNN